MSGYRKVVDVKVTIEGAEHVVRLKPMTFDQALAINDAGSAHNADTVEGKAARRRAQGIETRRMLPSVLVSITPPVLDSDGAEVSAEEVMGAAYFQKVAAQISGEWAEKATPANPS